MKLKCKLLIVTLLFSINAHALNVIIAKESIKFKEKINIKKLSFKQVSKIKKKCKPVTINYLNSKKFIAAHHINKGSILCERSLTVYQKKSVLFKFGTIEIEKNAKIINENDEYIMIKNENGKRDKIYKDGRIK